ncbi:putative Transcription factor domain-containing protein [Seiridium unicorne]|uniref:Transcription factor domain-containing protein n=1 Tax=Seiridium unicorne TaxID=138068 RepID=A0ABR2UT24_9PEZI
MVYSGPSKGCLACLKRRVKCDEAKPQCQRCQKAGRDCPGYRDPSRIKIRDMTATTIHRFEYDRPGARTREVSLFDQNYSQSVMTLRTRVDSEAIRSQEFAHVDGDVGEESLDGGAERVIHGLQSTGSGERWRGSVVRHVAPRPTLRVPPRTSAEQQAFAYFVNCYLDVQPQSLDPGYLDVLKIITRRESIGNCLQSCLSTLALAAFSRRPASRKAIIDTQVSYSVALKAVNDAVANPGSIFDDELLGSILVLALVECLISNRVTGYCNHLYGAITIFKSRGQRKFHDELGAELFLLLRFELIRTSVIRYLEPPDQYPFDWVLSAMEIVNDPCLAAAHAMTAESRRNRLSAVIHTKINENVGEDPTIGRQLSIFTLPSAFAPKAVLDRMIEGDPDLLGTLKKYLEMATEAFWPPEVPGHPPQDLQPDLCDAKIVPSSPMPLPAGLPAYSWKSMDHASFGLSLLVTHLYGCNVAADLAKRMSLRAPVLSTEEYQRLAEKARQAVAIIVGSIPFVCRQDEDVDGVGPNDYMWLHNVVPFVVALTSPFTTTIQRNYIESAIRWAADVKGINFSVGILNHWLQFQQSASSKGRDEDQQAPSHAQPTKT